MWMSDQERDFLLDKLSSTDVMLEYGSGSSTSMLQNCVKQLVSIEHHPGWYFKVKPELDSSVIYLLKEPDNPDWEQQYNEDLTKNVAGDDGSFEDFLSYVTAPTYMNIKFDKVLVDGRARVSCAWTAKNMLNTGGMIFVHDYGPLAKHPYLGYRSYYNKIDSFLRYHDHCETLYCFVK